MSSRGKSLCILTNPSADVIPFGFEGGFFFNSARHLTQQTGNPLYYLALVCLASREAVARCALFEKDNMLISPAAASFGSVEFVNGLSATELDLFIDRMIRLGSQTGTDGIRLVNYPDCYAPTQARRLREALLHKGFRIVRNDANHFILVQDDTFKSLLHPSGLRRIRKCKRSGFRAAEWVDAPAGLVYETLRSFRAAIGYPMPMPRESFMKLLTDFPEEFRTFAVWNGSVITALSVTVRISPDILYNFCPANNPNYRNFSPSVMLTEALYAYCLRDNIQLLDLGISVDHLGNPKSSLMQFKVRLGGLESQKVVYEYSFRNPVI